MKYLHYTLQPNSPFVDVYKNLRFVDLATISHTTFRQIQHCDPLRAFKCMSAQHIQGFGCAVLYRPEKYALVHYMPLLHSVTVVLRRKPSHLQFAVTVVDLPVDTFSAVNIMQDTLLFVQPYITASMPHIVAGNFNSPRLSNWAGYLLDELKFQEVLQQVDAGPTRFRRGCGRTEADYVYMRGPVTALTCVVRPIALPDNDCPIFIYFHFGLMQTWSL